MEGVGRGDEGKGDSHWHLADPVKPRLPPHRSVEAGSFLFNEVYCPGCQATYQGHSAGFSQSARQRKPVVCVYSLCPAFCPAVVINTSDLFCVFIHQFAARITLETAPPGPPIPFVTVMVYYILAAPAFLHLVYRQFFYAILEVSFFVCVFCLPRYPSPF